MHEHPVYRNQGKLVDGTFSQNIVKRVLDLADCIYKICMV